MAEDDTRVRIAAAIEAIDAKDNAADVIDTIAALSSERPRLVMDLTDPPSDPRYVLGDVEVSGATADAAAHALGDELRPHFEVLARAAVLPDQVDISAIASDAQAAVVEAAELARAEKAG